MEQSRTWFQRFAALIGQRVAQYRSKALDVQGRKMTAQGLADRTAELGHPMDRSVIAKLEKGHRETITVPELLVLARALNVSPVELIFPVGDQDEFEVLPGKTVPTWLALRWFTGEGPFVQEAAGVGGDGIRSAPIDLDDWNAWATGQPVGLFRRHLRLYQDWIVAGERADETQRRALEQEMTGDLDVAERLHDHVKTQVFLQRELEEGLRAVRRQIRAAGLRPPELPRLLSRIDDREVQT